MATTMELSEKGSASLQCTKTLASVEYIQAGKKTTKKPNLDKSKTLQKKFTWNDRNFKSKSNTKSVSISNVTCYRCGKGHFASDCTLDREIHCSGCYGKGHLHKVVCFKNRKQANQLEIL